MNKKISFFSLAVTLFCGIFILGGCSNNQFVNADHINELRVGMTKDEVLKIMGSPLSDEKFNDPNTWFYYYCTKWYDGLSTEDECYPLCFKDNVLIGFGYEFYMNQKIFNLKDKVNAAKTAKQDIISEIPPPDNPAELNAATPGVILDKDAYVLPPPVELPEYTPPNKELVRQRSSDNAGRTAAEVAEGGKKQVDVENYHLDDDVTDAELPAQK